MSNGRCDSGSVPSSLYVDRQGADVETQSQLPADPGDLLTQDAVRRAIGNPTRMTLYRWIEQGLFPRPRKLLRRNVWTVGEVQAFRAKVEAGDLAQAAPAPTRKPAKRKPRTKAKRRRS